MLEEGDQDDPMVNPIDEKSCEGCEEQGTSMFLPEVGNQVGLEYIKEPKFSDRVAQSSSPNENSDIRDHYLHPLLGRKDCRIGIKI